MTANNSHTLMGCFEVLDLMECAEAIFLTALERKETRAQHRRSDFPLRSRCWLIKFLSPSGRKRAKPRSNGEPGTRKKTLSTSEA